MKVGDWVEIPRSDVTLQDKLGEGAFGEVYKGLVRIGEQVRACAVKKLKGNILDEALNLIAWLIFLVNKLSKLISEWSIYKIYDRLMISWSKANALDAFQVFDTNL